MTKTEAERVAIHRREVAAKKGFGIRTEIGSMMFGDKEEFYVRVDKSDARSYGGSVTYWHAPPYARD